VEQFVLVCCVLGRILHLLITIPSAAGVLMVVSGFTFFGVLIEAFGFINLFGDFFPVVVGFLRSLPVIGPLLNAPGVSKVVDWLSGSGGSLPV